MPLRTRLVLVLLLAVACTPTLEDRTAIVSAPRVLAVVATPAEVGPNQNVTLRALYADASGTLTSAPLAWTFCNARKPLAELGPVARTCLDPASSEQVALGSGITASGRVPRDACRNFGPNPPASEPGEPAGRPVDPDVTGGYFQPALAFRTDDPRIDPTLYPLRIACGVANAPTEIAAELTQRYRRNQNPVIAGLVLVRDGQEPVALPPEGKGTPPTVAPGETVEITVGWPSCPSEGVCGDGVCSDDETRSGCPGDCNTPLGCGGAETYVTYDRDAVAVVRRRESMRVSWYANAGAFTDPRTGRRADELETTSANELTAPAASGDVRLWIVLRDERGGTAFETYRLAVSGP